MESTTLWRYIRLHREQEQLTWVKAIKIRIPHLRVQLNSIRAARKLFTSCVRTLRGGDDCGEQGANEEGSPLPGGAGAGAGWPLMVVEWACTACGKMETF